MIRPLLQRLRRDTGGVSAVEFALVAPVMVTALLGMVEINDLVTAYSKAVSAAQTVSDLASQPSSLVTAQLDSIVVAAQRTLDPKVTNNTNLSINITSIVFDANDVPKIGWAYHWGKASTPPAATIAANLGAANESVIVATLSYTCVPLIHEIVPQMTFSQTAITRPRTARAIALNGVTGLP